ncbi:MAG: bifunctional aldolase/short-chain dehydrogenase [Acidobacteria bacterium]|nr:bifunctional aldolase/short-chain dehydrogenase [Acidobacteriota bacterium]
MINRWSDDKAAQFIEQYRKKYGEDLAVGLYVASLIGAETRLVLHGGGNSSVKTVRTNLLGETVRTLFVKASGYDMASIEPDGYTGLELDYVEKLRSLEKLSDEDMVNAFRTHCLDARAATPSIETLVHVFVPGKFVDHTHPDSILALTNQAEGEKHLRAALGEGVSILPYAHPGFPLARAVAAELERNPGARAMVLMRHGLLTWGETARESYDTTIALASRAEKYVEQHARKPVITEAATPLPLARQRLAAAAPVIRGLLARPTGNPDHPWDRVIVRPLINRKILDLVDSGYAREFAATPPLTADHLIRTKPSYLWIENPPFEDPAAFGEKVAHGIRDYAAAYDAYVHRFSRNRPEGIEAADSLPRVILLPGLGAIAAEGSAASADIVRDIAEHTLEVKAQIAAMGEYRGMEEKDLFEMEFRAIQRRKLHARPSPPLAGHVALVTGAAGAIGAGITQELLEQGCHVAVTDLDGDPLHQFTEEMQSLYGPRVLGIALDVTDSQSVADAFGSVISAWGGIDLVVQSAGIAHVAPIEDMDLETFRRTERINIEGTLLILAESARLFRRQNTGGDIVVVSTKNVFAPGANFGAYSATKAAGHQLARIASQELAPMDVRVNMVAPDAVFSHGTRKSGLWMEVGPERMNARGLSAEGLEEYYRNRNLLKAKITARHVGRAVLFFATRQTPTTGCTLPVDGGLPDATPR